MVFKFGQKTLFNYRYCIFPSFVTDPVKDFIRFNKDMNTDERWQEFSKTVDENIYREPSLLYLYLTETDDNFRYNLMHSIWSFIANSPIEKWQGPLERDEISGQYNGFKYDQIESKGIRTGGFIPLSHLIAHFVRYLHYTLIYLVQKQKDDKHLTMILKCFSTLVDVTPYKKMNVDLLKSCMIPHITSMMTRMIRDEESDMSDEVHKSLLLCFSASSHLL